MVGVDVDLVVVGVDIAVIHNIKEVVEYHSTLQNPVKPALPAPRASQDALHLMGYARGYGVATLQ